MYCQRQACKKQSHLLIAGRDRWAACPTCLLVLCAEKPFPVPPSVGRLFYCCNLQVCCSSPWENWYNRKCPIILWYVSPQHVAKALRYTIASQLCSCDCTTRQVLSSSLCWFCAVFQSATGWILDPDSPKPVVLQKAEAWRQSILKCDQTNNTSIVLQMVWCLWANGAMSCALQGSPYLITRTQGLKPALKVELSEVTPVTFCVAGSHVNVKATLSTAIQLYFVWFCCHWF